MFRLSRLVALVFAIAMLAVAFSVCGEAVACTVNSGDPCCSHDDTTGPKRELVIPAKQYCSRAAIAAPPIGILPSVSRVLDCDDAPPPSAVSKSPHLRI